MVVGSNPTSPPPANKQDSSFNGGSMAIHQCAHCARKIDDQEDSYEAHEVVFDTGTHWRFYHAHCLDDLRSSEYKLKAMGKEPKQTVPKEVRSIKGSWSGKAVF